MKKIQYSIHFKKLSVIVLLLSFVLLSCQNQSISHQSDTQKTTGDTSKVHIVTSFYPLYSASRYLLQDLQNIEVHPVSKRSIDPAHFMPNDDEMKSLHQADLIILNGAQFESWESQVSLPQAKLIHSADVIKSDWLAHHKVTHKHGPEGDHTHEGIDGHTWLDPILFQSQVDLIYQKVSTQFINKKAEQILVEKRLHEIKKMLAEINTAWQRVSQKLKSSHLIANHEAYQYIAKRYQIKITSLDIDPDAPLSSKLVEDIKIAKSKTEKVAQSYFVWESQASKENQQLINTLGLKNLVIQPLETEESIRSLYSKNTDKTNDNEIFLYGIVMQKQVQNLLNSL